MDVDKKALLAAAARAWIWPPGHGGDYFVDGVGG